MMIDTEPSASHTQPLTHEYSAVSWGAVVAGAIAAAALSLILLILGTGLGLSSVSPWANSGAGAAAIGIGAIIWITLTQLLASGLGGYLAGRLRSTWRGVSTDEAFFRDSAHGFLAWALATLLTAGLLSSAISGIVSGSVQASGTVAAGAAAVIGGGAAAASDADSDGGQNQYFGYYIDSLLRKTTDGNVGVTSTEPPTPEALAEITRIFANAVTEGGLPKTDAQYLGQQIAQRTNLTSDEATQRVNETFNQLKSKLDTLEKEAREAADTARKASAYTALWLFISLLIGAFVAAFSATRARQCHTTCATRTSRN